MKIRWFGAALIIVGALMFGSGSFDFTTKKEVLDLGSVKVEQEKDHTFTWSPVLGIVLFLGGVGIFLFSSKKRSAF
ncbi:MAG: LPXTG cell wall anchor domain-containing protein [Cyclobacteriaceae bacterium]|jgi:LPXTG-motif cell wall-anchored protein